MTDLEFHTVVVATLVAATLGVWAGMAIGAAIWDAIDRARERAHINHLKRQWRQIVAYEQETYQ